jgi:hypothetical protein
MHNLVCHLFVHKRSLPVYMHYISISSILQISLTVCDKGQQSTTVLGGQTGREFPPTSDSKKVWTEYHRLGNWDGQRAIASAELQTSDGRD